MAGEFSYTFTLILLRIVVSTKLHIMFYCLYSFGLSKAKALMRRKIKSVSHVSRALMLPIQPAALGQDKKRFVLFLDGHR